MPELVIEDRFCGPPGIGNGGYGAGRLAALVAAKAAVIAWRIGEEGRKLDTSRNPAASADEGGLRLSGRQ